MTNDDTKSLETTYKQAAGPVLQWLDQPARSELLTGLVGAAELAAEDLAAFVARDPAARSAEYVRRSCRTWAAVSMYRLAHVLWDIQLGDDRAEDESKVLARQVSEFARVYSGVEIHPGAAIGRRFVVDHGFGTVIGETVAMGDDGYVLQAVVLGGRGVACNPLGKRHPTLGDRVEVAGFARVYGPVSVGDDCFLGPHTTVTADVPAGIEVLVRDGHQVQRPRRVLTITKERTA